MQEQEGHSVWGEYAQRLLDPGAGLWRNPGNGGHDDKAHPPIHPTKFSAGETGWSQDHHVSIIEIVKCFLATSVYCFFFCFFFFPFSLEFNV